MCKNKDNFIAVEQSNSWQSFNKYTTSMQIEPLIHGVRICLLGSRGEDIRRHTRRKSAFNFRSEI
jgi:hypothetical protein